MNGPSTTGGIAGPVPGKSVIDPEQIYITGRFSVALSSNRFTGLMMFLISRNESDLVLRSKTVSNTFYQFSSINEYFFKNIT